jgi:hypothetical protein
MKMIGNCKFVIRLNRKYINISKQFLSNTKINGTKMIAPLILKKW